MVRLSADATHTNQAASLTDGTVVLLVQKLTVSAFVYDRGLFDTPKNRVVPSERVLGSLLIEGHCVIKPTGSQKIPRTVPINSCPRDVKGPGRRSRIRTNH